MKNPEQNRKSNFGKMSASGNLGFILGPAIAGVLSMFFEGYHMPVIFALIISLIGSVIIVLWLTEIIPEFTEAEKKSNSFKTIIKIKHVPYMYLLYFLIFLGFNFFYTAFPNHAMLGLEWPPEYLGPYFSTLGILMFLVQGPLMSTIGERFSAYTLLIFGSLILCIQFFLLIPSSAILAYVALLFFALGNGMMWPSYLSILSACGSKAQQGTIQGIGTSFGSLASILGLILGGFLYNSLGSFTFLIAGSIIFVVFLLSFKSRQIQNDGTATETGK